MASSSGQSEVRLVALSEEDAQRLKETVRYFWAGPQHSPRQSSEWEHEDIALASSLADSYEDGQNEERIAGAVRWCLDALTRSGYAVPEALADNLPEDVGRAVMENAARFTQQGEQG